MKRAAAPPVHAPGVVYTPDAVTLPMVARALGPLLEGRGPEDVLALRVCDPALGDGAFLRAALTVLADAVAARGMAADAARTAVAARCLFGVERDPAALAAARTALARAAGGPVPEAHLCEGDALALAWPDAFPTVFAAGGFDAVIGNPPYIRQELFAPGKPALRRYAVYAGGADLYVYFVELTHQILRTDGRWCLVLPNKWLTAAYGRPLRAYLASAGSLDGIIDFAEAPRLFADADAFPCIAWGTRRSPAAARPAIAAARTRDDAATALAPTAPLATVDRARWGDAPWHLDPPDDAALLARLAAQWPPLGEVLEGPPARGLVTGCNRAFVIDAATRARLLDADPAVAAFVRPFVRGRDVRRWTAAPPRRYVLTIGHDVPEAALPAALRAHLAPFRDELRPRPDDHVGAWPGRKPGRYAWHQLQDPIGPLVAARGPRLLYQDIQTQPACSLDRDGELAPDTTVWTLPSDDRVLLAILNSSLYGWYARLRFPPALGGAVRPKRAYVLGLPIARPTAAARAQLAALVDAQLAAPTAARDAEIDAAVLAAYGVTGAEAGQISRTRSAVQRSSPPARRIT